jgi:oxygen-independent coproporphyrinogen-3 oxidase
MLGLYLHVPFCQSICGYCNFNRGLLDEALKARYVEALAREIGGAGDGRAADTIFFGGGTPSLLSAAEVGRLIAACRGAFDVASSAEVTLEANPETVTETRLSAFREAGVTRVSFGVQSFDDRELRRLDRAHSAACAVEAVAAARRAGFGNVSFDLMFWLPGQPLQSWLATVDRAVSLAPDHLSLYLLELYPNAPLRDTMARAVSNGSRDWTQAPDDEAADMYLAALNRLDEAGYEQYEISNVARPGFACRHNVKYWQGGQWLGFGCGAHSTDRDRRWRNVAATAEYIERVAAGAAPRIEQHRLSAEERAEEALFTGLRLSAGIDRAAFRARFGFDPWARFGRALAPAAEAGHLWRTDAGFGLTRTGMLVANEILQVFV